MQIREENVGTNTSIYNRLFASILGFIYGGISAAIRMALVLTAAVVLSPFTLVYSLAVSLSYFYKQKDYNPLLTLLLGLPTAIYLAYCLTVNSLLIVYPTIFHPFKGMYIGYQKGLFETLKHYSLEISNYPKHILHGSQLYISKFKKLLNIVNYSQNDYRILMQTVNEDAFIALSQYVERIYYVKIHNTASDSQKEALQIQRNILLDELNTLRTDSRNNVGIIKTSATLIVKWSFNIINEVLERHVISNHTTQGCVEITVDKEPNISYSSNKYPSEDTLNNLCQEHKDLKQRYSDLKEKIDQSLCSISRDVPIESDKIILYKQYSDDGSTNWKPVPRSTFIFSRTYLEQWFQISRTNPLNREDVDNPQNFKNKTTRINYCAFHGDGDVINCPEMREILDEIEAILLNKHHDNGSVHYSEEKASSNGFIDGNRSSPAVTAGTYSPSTFSSTLTRQDQTDRLSDRDGSEHKYFRLG